MSAYSPTRPQRIRVRRRVLGGCTSDIDSVSWPTPPPESPATLSPCPLAVSNSDMLMAHTAARVGCVRLLGRLAVTGLGRLDAGHLARPRRRGRGLYRGSRALTCLGAGALPRRRAADIHQRPMPISFISRLIKGAFETALCPADELLIYTICATLYGAIRAVGAGALPPRRVAAPHHRCPPPPPGPPHAHARRHVLDVWGRLADAAPSPWSLCV